MFTAYKKFWMNYVNFTGRTSRSDYWWTVLCNFLITMPFVSTIVFIFYSNYFEYMSTYLDESFDPTMSDSSSASSLFTVDIIILMVLVFLFALAILLPNLAISVRRLRDAGLHWSLIFIPVGTFLLSFLMLVPFLRAIASIIIWFATIFYYILLCQPTKPYQAPAQLVQPTQVPQQGQMPQQQVQQPVAQPSQPTVPVQPQAPTNQQQ